jgi:hypothetical protein
MRDNEYRRIPRWMWLIQIVLFRTLGGFIAVHETIISPSNKFQWESLVFAGWLFLFPDAVKGRGLDILSRLIGGNQQSSGDEK